MQDILSDFAFAARFWIKVNKNGPMPLESSNLRNNCWLWEGGVNSDGSGRFRYKGVSWQARRLALEFAGICLGADELVLVQCNNKLCLRHLMTAPKSKACDRKLAPPQAPLYGEKHPNSKLYTVDVLKIRELARVGMPAREIASTYDVSLVTVRKILQRRLWRHV